MEEGGYSVVLETKEDLELFKQTINYDVHPCEWVVEESMNCGYLCALYLLNDDFSILLYLPKAIAPDTLLKDLEEAHHE